MQLPTHKQQTVIIFAHVKMTLKQLTTPPPYATMLSFPRILS